MTSLSASPIAVPGVIARTARWQVLIGAVMVQLILGTLYGYSVFWQPLESELWPAIVVRDEADAAAVQGRAIPSDAVIVADAAEAVRARENRIADLKYAFAICLLSFATAMIFAGRLQDMKGPRFTATLGGAILGAGFLIAGQMDQLVTFYICHAFLLGTLVVAALLLFDAFFKEWSREDHPILQYIPYGVVTVVIVAGVILGLRFVSNQTHDRLLLLWTTIGLLAGVGIGYCYVGPIAALVKWFPAQKGLVSGIAVAGFGFGAYLFSGKSALGAVGFIARYGIRTFFTVHGLVCAVVVILGAMMLRNPPTATVPAPAGRRTDPSPDSNWQQLLRNNNFYLVWLMFFSGAMAGLMVIGILKPFAGSQLITAAEKAGGPLSDALRSQMLLQGATAVGVLALFNAGGRVVWGFLSDRLGRTPAMTLMFTLQGVTLLALSTLDTPWRLAAGAASVGFNFGGNFALFPSLTADLFGTKNFGANYGWVFTSYGVAGVMGVWAGNIAQQATGSYFAAFAVAAALCFASALLAMVLGRRIRRPLPVAV